LCFLLFFSWWGKRPGKVWALVGGQGSPRRAFQHPGTPSQRTSLMGSSFGFPLWSWGWNLGPCSWASTLPLSHTPAPLGLSFQGEQRKSMWRELPGASTKPPPRLEVTSSSWTRPRRAIWLTELMLESLGGGGGQRSLVSVMCWGKKRSHCIQHRYGACQRSGANLIGDFSL
jgi:hypothetical protein